MSFINKVKNFFYEEIEEDDDEELLRKEALKRETKQKKQEEKAKTRVEKRAAEDKPSNPDLSERELFKSERTFNFPMDVGDNIFDETITELEEPVKSRSEVKEEKNIYARSINNTTTRKVEPSTERITSYTPSYTVNDDSKKFRPSPVVSPVYGILDKNYTVEDVVDKSLSKTKEFSLEKKTVDFDTVRNRAYKDLDEEIERTLTNSKDIFYNLDKEENEISEEAVDEKVEKDINDLKEFISNINDTSQEESKNDDVVITYDDNEEENTEYEDDIDDISFETPDVEIPKVEPKKTRKKTKNEVLEEAFEESEKKDEEEKEDLFNLIDNMYNDDDDDEEED